MSNLSRYLFGAFFATVICLFIFYYKEILIDFGGQFVVGFISALIFILVIGVLFFSYFDYSSKGNEDLTSSFINKAAEKYLPDLEDSIRIDISSRISQFMAGRSLYLSFSILFNLFIAIGGIVGTIVLLKQNDLLLSQNNKIETQNTLFSDQNEKINFQNELLVEQSTYILKQTDLFEKQNKLLSNQNGFIKEQSDFLKNESYANSIGRLKNQLSDKNASSENRLFAFTELIKLASNKAAVAIGNKIDFYNPVLNDLEIRNNVIKNLYIRGGVFNESKIIDCKIINTKFQTCFFRNLQFEDTEFQKCQFENCFFSISSPMRPISDMAKRVALNFNKWKLNSRFHGDVIFNNCDFENVGFQFMDLRNTSGISFENFSTQELKDSLLFGLILEVGNIQEAKMLELKECGVVFDRDDASKMVNYLQAIPLGQSNSLKLGMESLIKYYEEVEF